MDVWGIADLLACWGWVECSGGFSDAEMCLFALGWEGKLIHLLNRFRIVCSAFAALKALSRHQMRTAGVVIPEALLDLLAPGCLF